MNATALHTEIETAIRHGVESSAVDYKASFDPSSAAEWLEVIKDLVAFANSGGGVIIFGIADDGSAGAFDCTELNNLDPATVTDKIYKYTSQQLHGFEFCKMVWEGRPLFAIAIHAAAVPIVFVRPGTYDIGGGKQKTAFSAGTVYFRHGAKSEPGNSDDLRLFIEDRIEKVRKAWFEGIVKVVEAPPGSEVQITPASTDSISGHAAVRLVNDPNAPAMRQVSIDETHPFRQKEIIAEVNRRLGGEKTINSFHIQCVRQAYDIETEPALAYKMKYSSTRYSSLFVDWLIEQHNLNADFFEDAKRRSQTKKGLI